MRLVTLLLVLSVALFADPSIAAENASFVGLGDLPGGYTASLALAIGLSLFVWLSSMRSGVRALEGMGA